ncbi:MAG: tRNA (adenosine(37)-N6)-dimethylallyltransferase MiaA [Anaerolineales bacterium]|nr:tRNA (adenosine(37)-N6)-dimethylallyltransferase MiaA [Anaerolineales bacterium]
MARSSPLLTLLGPTAVGKTELSLQLAERFGGEIVSADSRQIYRGMDIGTAKATPAEQARAPHHLLDLRAPDEVITLAEFQALAYATIDDIHRRARLPILAGGTVLYVRAVVEGLRIPAVAPDPVLRAQLEAELAEHGVAALADRLRSLDPAGAAQTDLRNPRRVLRALEIVIQTGQSQRELEGADPPAYRMLTLALTRDRTALYPRIDARVDAMIAAGLLDETRRLVDAGYDPALPAMTSLGYREMVQVLKGELTMGAAAEHIKTETHRYVRHQMTWLRKLPYVEWVDLDTVAPGEVVAQVAAWLEGAESH